MEIPFGLFDDMTMVGKLGDVFFLVLAYPCVMIYLYIYGDGSGGPGSGEAARRSTRYEKASKAAMKERKKNEPPLHLPMCPEISTTSPSKQGLKADLLKRWTQKPTAQEPVLPCRLLSLPYEIREQIYLEVLGHKTFHIVQLPKRLGHRTCTSTSHDNIICPRSCYSETSTIQTYRHGDPLDPQATSDATLSLLLTTRQIYHEATPLLYTTSTFDISHPQTLLFLSRTLRPSTLASIRHLNLTWSGNLPFIEKDPSRAPDDHATWVETWRIIGAEMKGLRSLTVRMVIFDDEVEKARSGPFLVHARKRWTTNGVQFEKLLQPMREGVRGLREFGLGVELPEVVVWDVKGLEGELREVVCGERGS